MEVHHHPDLHHKRKNFREYFLEFLMIFLAVTMGFLAESLREHFGDKEKEREYVSSLVQNLKDDTAMFHNVIRENKVKMDALGLLAGLRHKDMNDSANRRLLYKYSRWIGHYSMFRGNDATLLQLKNSGGLRYIRRGHAADSIANYAVEITYVYSAEQMYVQGTQAAIDAAEEVVEFDLPGDGGADGWPVFTKDPRQWLVFFNKVYTEKGWTENYINNMAERLPLAERLLAFLQKEYDLD
jgi:hypothetical protein